MLPRAGLVQEGVQPHQVGASVQAFCTPSAVPVSAADGDDGEVVADFALEQAQHSRERGFGAHTKTERDKGFNACPVGMNWLNT